jgi:hypothetical protein
LRQTLPQGGVDYFFEAYILVLADLLDQGRNIIVETKCGPHTSKHNEIDVLMSIAVLGEPPRGALR